MEDNVTTDKQQPAAEGIQKSMKKYSLLTAVAMIVGIVIGSGIYFKADDILRFTGGDVGLGMLVIALGSLSIIFGSLTISELAQRNSQSGGLSSYYEAYIHPGIAAAYGFFMAYLYFPTVIAVVSWVASIYTWVFLGKEVSLETQIVLAVAYVLLLGFINIVSRLLGGYFQDLTTAVKIVPLAVVGLMGLFWAQGQPEVPAGLETVQPSSVGWGWVAGLVPLAYAFEGWVAVAGIAPEVKNPQKNLSKAFIIGPLVILSLYLLFFYGLSRILGPTFILSTGDEAITFAVAKLFGHHIGKFLTLIVIISVLGVVNGLLLATMRLPQAYASRGWIQSRKMAELHPRFQLSVPSALSVIATVLFYLLVHYVTEKFSWLPGGDISEITIVFNNLCLILLYLVVLKLYVKGEVKNKLTGLVAPIFAVAGSLMMLIGSLMNNFKMVSLFLIFCFLFNIGGFAIYKANRKKQKAV